MGKDTKTGTGSTKGSTPTQPAVSLRPAVPWLLIMLALGIAAVITGIVRIGDLPDPYPVHFGPAGDPDRFTDRTIGAVLLPVIVGQLSGIAFFAICAAMRTTQLQQRIVTPLAVCGAVIGGGISLISIMQYLSDDAVPPPWTFWALLVAILASTAWVVIASTRAERKVPGDRAGWHLGGLIYANPDNADVFVPKRLGVGVTINLGQPLGWLLAALVLLPGILIIVAVTAWT